MLIRVICSDRYLPEMDLDMLQTEVHEEVFFDVTPSGSLRPERRLIYRLVGNLKADRGQPCYEFAREVDVVQKRNGCVGPVR